MQNMRRALVIVSLLAVCVCFAGCSYRTPEGEESKSLTKGLDYDVEKLSEIYTEMRKAQSQIYEKIDSWRFEGEEGRKRAEDLDPLLHDLGVQISRMRDKLAASAMKMEMDLGALGLGGKAGLWGAGVPGGQLDESREDRDVSHIEPPASF